MIKKSLIIFINLYLCNSYILYAQKVILKGVVKDSLQTSLPYANVIAQPTDKTQNLQFAITDSEGYYRLVLAKESSYTIRVSYLGYKPVEFPFTATNSLEKDIVLKASPEQLDEIVIEMPVTIRGDTTTYNTEKFVTGEERKLKNVLKKLPGVEVDKKGNVTVQGKKVTQMLVDGKKFFGGGSKLAVENIPADAVGKIEVIDNYNEIAFLKNLSDSDEMAMNVQLKEDKKRFVFGDIEAGKGNKDFYKTHANLFYYAPKTNVNFIGNSNTIGEKTFTFSDYLSFSGGINAVFNGDFNWGGGDFSQFLESEDLTASNQQFGAINIIKTTSSTLDISGYAIFSHTRTHSFLESLNDYTTLNFVERKEDRKNTKNTLGIGKFTIAYTPNALEKWTLRTQIKKTNNNHNNQILSFVTDTNTIARENNLQAIDINQNIEWHKQQAEKHTFSGIINYTFQKNNQNNFWQTNRAILQTFIPFESAALYKLNQFINRKEQHIDAVFKHFWEVSNNHHIYTTIGNKYVIENFTTEDTQVLDTGVIHEFNSAGFNNDVDFSINDLFLGIHYKFRTGIFTFKQGVMAHSYSWNINQETQIQKNKWVVLPDFLAKIAFNKSKKLQFNYNLKTSFSDASRFANRFYLRSYNTVFKGNEDLTNELFHTARIYYSRFSLYRGLLLNASVNYTKKVRGIVSAIGLEEVENTNPNYFSTVRLLHNPSENINFRGAIQKRIHQLKYKLRGSVSSAKYLQETDAIITTNTSKNYSYELGIETLYSKFPTIEIGYKRTIGNFTSNSQASKFITQEPFVTIDYDFLKGFVFSFDYRGSYYENKLQNQKNIYEIANTSLLYQKENSAWSYKITANNLFDTNFKQSNGFSEYLISDTKTYILPRIFMFSIAYNL